LFVGKTFYTKFAIDGKRNEPVIITKLDYGIWETPVKVFFKSKSMAKDSSILVNVCGTNVPGSYTKSFHFSKYFSCESLRSTEAIKIGMSLNELSKKFGKLHPVERVETAKGVTTKYKFQDIKFIFENDKLVKIESNL